MTIPLHGLGKNAGRSRRPPGGLTDDRARVCQQVLVDAEPIALPAVRLEQRPNGTAVQDALDGRPTPPRRRGTRLSGQDHERPGGSASRFLRPQQPRLESRARVLLHHRSSQATAVPGLVPRPVPPALLLLKPDTPSAGATAHQPDGRLCHRHRSDAIAFSRPTSWRQHPAGMVTSPPRARSTPVGKMPAPRNCWRTGIQATRTRDCAAGSGCLPLSTVGVVSRRAHRPNLGARPGTPAKRKPRGGVRFRADSPPGMGAHGAREAPRTYDPTGSSGGTPASSRSPPAPSSGSWRSSSITGGGGGRRDVSTHPTAGR